MINTPDAQFNLEVLQVVFPNAAVSKRISKRRLSDLRAVLNVALRATDSMLAERVKCDHRPAAGTMRRDNPFTRGFDRIHRERAQRGTPGGKIGATVPTA